MTAVKPIVRVFLSTTITCIRHHCDCRSPASRNHRHARRDHRHGPQGVGESSGHADRHHRVIRCSAGKPPDPVDGQIPTQVVPNLQFGTNAPLAGNNSSSQVFIRGVGQTDPDSLTVDPGVGLYIDDVYIGSVVGGTMSLRDISNVQVLRGPQGTLFGRNTISALLLSTTDPGSNT